jgi:hypothetical protein
VRILAAASLSLGALLVTGPAFPARSHSLSGGGTASLCNAAQLKASAGFQGATGSDLGGLSIKNTSGHPCALPLTPRVSLIWHGISLAVRQVAFPTGWLKDQFPHTTPLHRLRAGQTALVVLQWWNWCGPQPLGRSFRGSVQLRLPGAASSLLAPVHNVTPPYCNAPPSTLRVSSFLAPP